MKILFWQRRNHTNMYPALDALMDQGHEVVAVAVQEHPNEIARPESVTVRRHGGVERFRRRLPPRARYFFGDYPGRALKDVILSEVPDLVVVKGDSRLVSMQAARWARAAGAGTVIYNQQPVHGPPLSKLRRWQQNYISSGGVWFSPVLGDAENQPRREGAHYLPFCMAPKAPSPVKRNGAGPVTFLMMGQFHMRRKNHLEFLTVVRSLVRKGHNIRTIMAGQGAETNPTLQAVRAFITDNNLNDHVDVKVSVPFDRVEELYRAADVYVLPSHDEPASISVLEAMSYGLPVIASDSNGTSCYIDDGRSGFVFRSRDWGQLEDMCAMLLSDARREAFGVRAAELVYERHAPTEWYRAFTEIIDKA